MLYPILEFFNIDLFSDILFKLFIINDISFVLVIEIILLM